MQQKWTEGEVCFLTDNYESLSYLELGAILKRSQASLCCKAKKLGITKPTSRRKNLAKQRYGKLVAVEHIRKDANGQCRWLCQCDCGNMTEISIGNWGHTKSCGCLSIETHRKDLSGQLFGQLTAIEYDHTEGKKAFWKCVCACGTATITRSAYLLHGDAKSCGNCQDFVNGKLVSFPQRAIAAFVDGQLNYQVGRAFIDIALPVQRIAIEYNGWYWHKDRKTQDELRTKELLDDGWCVIVIKSGAKVPEDKDMETLIETATQGQQYQELTLSDWLGYN